jgi:prepilin peptidase dependent protein B
MMSKHKQVGMTLIELLIAITLGLIVTAAVIGLFTSVLSANNTNLNEIRLNQELRAIMSLMARDIRRAGYNGSAAADVSVNPFSSETSPSASTDTVLTVTGGNTVYFSYDADDDGVLDNGEVFGYQFATDTINYCQGNAIFISCVANWQPLSDNSVVNITGLSLILVSSTEQAGTTSENDIRQLTITLTGQWVNDTDFTRTVTESVKLRNEHFASW